MAKIKDERALRREIAAADKLTRVNDGDGLYLLLKMKGGGRAWRFDYSFNGKRKTLSLGIYPDVSLAAARQRRADAQALLTAGVDPSAARREERKAKQLAVVVELRIERGQALPGSFRETFEQWHRTKSPGWSESYAEKVSARIKNDILPWLGDMPIAEIDEKALLECLRRVQARGAIESAHSTLQNCGQVFRFAIVSGLCSRNPAQGMSEALKPVIVKHQAAVTDPDQFAALMVAIGGYRGSILTRHALTLLAMTYQRTYNVRAMRWADLDLDAAMWTIPSMEMKRKRQAKISGKPHLVPLCAEAVAMLRELQPLSGAGEYVFVATHTSKRPMSENTMNMALRRMGIGKDEQTGHGFRATAETLLVERLGVPKEVVEAALAHSKGGPLAGAYDRTQYMEQRRDMYRMWGRVVADCAKGLPFPKTALWGRVEAERAKGLPAPKAATKKRTAEKPTPLLAQGDAKAMAALFEKLTGMRVSAAELTAELAKIKS